MMTLSFNQRVFLRLFIIALVGIMLSSSMYAAIPVKEIKVKRIGIIGLDVSHSIAFIKLLNNADADTQFSGYKVTVAYAGGSKDIEASASRVEDFTLQAKDMNVEIVSSIAEVIKKSDVIMLNSNDGRLHLQQALEVLKAGKRLFIDKPLAAQLPDVLSIFDASKKLNVPVFSSSSLRYIENEQEVFQAKNGKIIGADTYSPAILEKYHSDYFWYGIHGVEILYRLLGTGCKKVSTVSTESTDIVTGVWNDDRLGTFRAMRTGKHDYGATVFSDKAITNVILAKGTKALLIAIIAFFETGVSPVRANETIEVYTFMEAAAKSKRENGKAIDLQDVLNEARLAQNKIK